MKRLQSLLLILMATVSSVAISTEVVAESLQLERLTWAGVKMQLNDTTVFIDAVGTDLWQGNAPEGLVEVSADTTRRYALITHLHNDHFDVETLRRVPIAQRHEPPFSSPRAARRLLLSFTKERSVFVKESRYRFTRPLHEDAQSARRELEDQDGLQLQRLLESPAFQDERGRRWGFRRAGFRRV